MSREYQVNLVTPINTTCYLCNESLGSSLCNYCKSQFPFHDLDDNVFKIVLYEFQHGTTSYDADHLETLFFNPTLSDPNSDLDPDVNNQNYDSSARYCSYETAEDLNEVIGGNNLISFSLFHLNAHSLVKNQDALAHLLANINHTFSVLAITETWLKESNINDISFEGYNFVSNHCADKTGRGVGLFVDQNISYKILPELNVAMQIHIVIGVIYRPLF